MDKDNIVNDISKDFASVCYTVNCNNTSTKSIKIPLNVRISCIVYVCDNCYPKYLQSKVEQSTTIRGGS